MKTGIVCFGLFLITLYPWKQEESINNRKGIFFWWVEWGLKGIGSRSWISGIMITDNSQKLILAFVWYFAQWGRKLKISFLVLQRHLLERMCLQLVFQGIIWDIDLQIVYHPPEMWWAMNLISFCICWRSSCSAHYFSCLFNLHSSIVSTWNFY